METRIFKINGLLKQEVGKIIFQEIDFENALVTITHVETSPDLKYAKIKIKMIPDTKEKKILNILAKNIFEIQQILNKKLKMRPVPKIRFEIDKTESNAQKVEEILSKLNK